MKSKSTKKIKRVTIFIQFGNNIMRKRYAQKKKKKNDDDKIVIWYIWYIYSPIKEKPKYLIQIRFPPGYTLSTPTENDRSIFTLIPQATNNVMALCMTSANARSNACSITQSAHISAKSMTRSVHTKLLPATLSLIKLISSSRQH